MIQREDLLAYLVVLNYYPVIQKMSTYEVSLGSKFIEGCLIRLIDQLEELDHEKRRCSCLSGRA